MRMEYMYKTQTFFPGSSNRERQPGKKGLIEIEDVV